MSEPSDVSHVAEATLERFVRQVFSALGASEETAHLAARSLLDASLAGVDSHGVEALDMYVAHLRAGGLDARAELALLRERGGLSLWDMRSGFGLAGARRLMAHVMGRAGDFGVAMATCRRTNHLGACGVYARMAADVGLIGIVGQQARALFPPVGGRTAKIGPSPMAVAAPVEGRPAFCYDATLAAMTLA